MSTTICLVDGHAVPRGGPGRRRSWCSDRCRRRAWSLRSRYDWLAMKALDLARRAELYPSYERRAEKAAGILAVAERVVANEPRADRR